MFDQWLKKNKITAQKSQRSRDIFFWKKKYSVTNKNTQGKRTRKQNMQAHFFWFFLFKINRKLTIGCSLTAMNSLFERNFVNISANSNQYAAAIISLQSRDVTVTNCSFVGNINLGQYPGWTLKPLSNKYNKTSKWNEN